MQFAEEPTPPSGARHIRARRQTQRRWAAVVLIMAVAVTLVAAAITLSTSFQHESSSQAGTAHSILLFSLPLTSFGSIAMLGRSLKPRLIATGPAGIEREIRGLQRVQLMTIALAIVTFGNALFYAL
jgi:hypothetical protein